MKAFVRMLAAPGRINVLVFRHGGGVVRLGQEPEVRDRMRIAGIPS